MRRTAFHRYIGIDYSGAQTADTGLKGLRVYLASRGDPPAEVTPPPGSGRHWCRRRLAQWLVARLSTETPTLVGIDHSFSFPLRYFERHELTPDWPAFLDDFQRHWPTDEAGVSVELVRRGLHGSGGQRDGDAHWRRIAEVRARAKSVFHFDVPGSVAKSTHAGLPWLRYLRRKLGTGIHFWPFDGWELPTGRSVVAEVYPSLWSRDHPDEGRTPDQQDAYAAAAWLRAADLDHRLAPFLKPSLTPEERRVACFEGWILGVM